MTRAALSAFIAVDALLSAGAELVPVEPIRKEYPPQPEPISAPKPSRFMPHIGKKQIAKALRRMKPRSDRQ